MLVHSQSWPATIGAVEVDRDGVLQTVLIYGWPVYVCTCTIHGGSHVTRPHTTPALSVNVRRFFTISVGLSMELQSLAVTVRRWMTAGRWGFDVLRAKRWPALTAHHYAHSNNDIVSRCGGYHELDPIVPT